MCNDDALFNELSQITQSTGEKIWRLPLAEEVREQIKSHHADIMKLSRALGFATSGLGVPVVLRAGGDALGRTWTSPAWLTRRRIRRTPKKARRVGALRTLVEWIEHRANRS